MDDFHGAALSGLAIVRWSLGRAIRHPKPLSLHFSTKGRSVSRIEIYVRQSGNETMLNIYLDEKTKQQVLTALATGRFESRDVPIHLELPVLPKWLAGEDKARARVPITTINVMQSD